MKYEEASQYAKGGLEVYQRDYPELITQIEFQKLVIKALEKQEKYKVHDLRKNPEDLPENNAQVIVKVMGVYLVCDYCDKCFEYSMPQEFTTGYLYSSDISEWRYLEGFEGDNE